MARQQGMKKISTGLEGLNDILKGGFIQGNSYLLTGGPGTGKTTAGLEFLCNPALGRPKSLFVSFSEPVGKIRRDAEKRTFNLENVEFLDLTPSQSDIRNMDYTIFAPDEVEASPIIKRIIDRIEGVKPERIYLDGVSQLKYISADTYQFRKQLLILLNVITGSESTLLLSSESSETLKDDDLQFICDGVINLLFTGEERGIRVKKFRGSSFKPGVHSITLGDEGMAIFPKITPEDLHRISKKQHQTISSGITEIDNLLHGGIERGTTTVISGPTGVGKSTLAAQFAYQTAVRGEHTLIYTFEETAESIITRCKNINMPIESMFKQGNLSIEKINPLEYTPIQFAHLVKEHAKKHNTSMVVLDSISGYELSFIRNIYEFGQKEEMLRSIHILAEHLKSMGISLILINEVHDITGDFKVSEHGISYIADNILFIRYIEVGGRIERAIGVLKKRLSDFEKTLREFNLTAEGINVGRPLSELRGVLSGVPEIVKADN